MTILHYILGLPPVRLGGLVQYALDLAGEQQQLGNNVSIIIPGKYGEGVTQITEGVWKSFTCYAIENSLPVTAGNSVKEIEKLYVIGEEEIYARFLKNTMPDIIHIHTFMGLHMAFLKAAKSLLIPVVYTTHDYFGLCFNATLFRNDHCICDGNWMNCNACMGKGISVKRIAQKQSEKYIRLKSYRAYQWLEYAPVLLPLKQNLRRFLKKTRQLGSLDNQSSYCDENRQYGDKIKKYEKLKAYYREMFGLVTYFHFNSRQSQDIYREHLGEVEGKVVYLSKRNIADRRKLYKYDGKLKLGFIAYDNPCKGFHILKAVLDEMYEEGMKDVECHLFANYWDKTSPYIKMHRPYKNENMEQAYANFDVLVQPSLCKETFSFTTYEAVSLGKPVIVSENVAAKEILEDLCIVADAEKQSLKSVLVKIYTDRSILENLNKAINEADLDFDYFDHCNEMMKMYEQLKGN